jgi:hypothetical protein
MSRVYIPQQGYTYKLLEDFSTKLSWDKRNLVLLNNLGYAWRKPTSYGTPGPVVPNKMFSTDDGKFVPIGVVFPENTEFVLSRYIVSKSTGYMHEVWIKISDCKDPRFNNRCATLSLSDFNKCNLELVK